MHTMTVPAALVERLGDTGSTALADMFIANNRACTDDVLEKTAERFERRLIEETSKIRVDMAQMKNDLSRDIADVLKWNFVFWVGQAAVLFGIISLLLRGR